MLAKKRDGTAGLQVDANVDMSRDYHKIRYRPYRQSNSLSSKSLLDVNVPDQPKEGYISLSPKHVHQPLHQSTTNNNNNSSSSNSNSNNNNNNNQGNDQYQNHHHNHHHHNHHHGSRLSRGSTHDIPDGRTSPAKVEIARRERRTMGNKRSNSLFTHPVTNLDNAHGPGQPSAPTTPTASITPTPTTVPTPTPLPVSPNTAVTVTPSEYGSDRRKMLIQQRRNNGQFGGHGAIYASNDVGNSPKVSGPPQQHFPPQHQYHGHSQPQQHPTHPIAVGNTDYYTCHSNGDGSVPRGSDRTPKGLKNAPSLSKRAEKERQIDKSRPNSCSGSRDCPSRNGSFRISTDQGNGFSDAGSVRGGGGGAKKHSVKSGRGTPLISESETSVKVTDPTDPGGGQNNGVFSNKPYHNQQKSNSHFQQSEDPEHRTLKTNGKMRSGEGNLAKEESHRGVNPLRSLMKWEYEDLYGHLHKTGDRMTPVRPVRPKSAGVSARTHTIMSDSDDSSLDGDIEYVDLEELSDGEDAIVMTDSEVAAASSSLANSKQRVPKSWKDSSSGSVGIRRAYSMKDGQANSFVNENSRHVNKISQEARRLRCNDSGGGGGGGKPDTKWIFAEKKTQHSNYQKNSRRDSHLRVRDSVDPPSNNTYRRHLHAKKDMFDLSSFKDNLSFSQTESLAAKSKKNDSFSFSVTGEQLATEGRRHPKSRQCGPEATDSSQNEKGETVSRRNLHAPFPRRLKPLFGNIVEDSES